MVLAIGNDGQFARFCIAAGYADKAVEPLFATNPARVANRATLVPLLTSWTLTRTTAEWADLLEHAAVPCSPILDVAQVLACAAAPEDTIYVAGAYPYDLPFYIQNSKPLVVPVQYVNANAVIFSPANGCGPELIHG